VPGAAPLVETLRGGRVFHFQDTGNTAPVKQQGYTADNRSLHPDAGNLAAVMLRLRQADHARYQRIVRTVKQVAPFFRDFVLEPELATERVRRGETLATAGEYCPLRISALPPARRAVAQLSP
jgi:predicted ATPase